MITAIRNKKRQQAMVIFPEPFSIFANEDIAANGGIEFSELLNSDENLCMGRAVQSNVSVALINSDKLLSSVDFMQEFIVSLGVEIDSGEVSVRSDATLGVKVGDHVITATGSRVYFDSTAYSVAGTPAALFVYEDKMFVIGTAGAVINAFTISGNTMTTATLPEWNAFMRGKCAKWATAGKCLSYVDGIMHESAVSDGVMAYRTSQFAPLGHFVGSKPDKVKTQIVSLSGDDLMQRFEKTAQEYFDTLTYPATLETLFIKLCEHCGVEAGDVSAALNMDKQFDAAPIDNDVSTCREVLAYIAEAAGCYARISRDGKCELVWFSDVDYTLNRTDYFSIDMAEYEVQRIDKLQSHVTQDDIGVIVGEGTNGYDIIDNPYLNGATDAEMRPWVENIYNRLSEFEEYSPITVACESNWTLRCGDIITVVTEEGNKLLPIFAQTISWAGNARASIQSTGDMIRGTMSATNREKLVNGRRYLEIKKSVDGLDIEAVVRQGDEFHSASVDITAEGVSATVDDEVRLLIDENGVKAPLIRTEEIRVLTEKGGDKYTTIAKSVDSSEDLWKGSVQASIDSLPKYLATDCTLTVPEGTYSEDVVIAGFVGSKLTIQLSQGVKINGTVRIRCCDAIAVNATTLGDAAIYPPTAGLTVGVFACQHVWLTNLQISGYRRRTTSSNGSANVLSIEDSNARVHGCCIEYAGSGAAYVQRGGTFDCAVCSGGSSGNDPMTNANIGYGVQATLGAHGVLRTSVPLSAKGNIATNATLLNSSMAGAAGGMEYVAPTEFTKSFAISKHCTYVFGDKRIRDDQSTWISQGRYGEYETSSHNNYWRLGAMWFADAASALVGKTIKSAKLKIRRGAGGGSSAVDVYLHKVELTESNFSSTTKPVYPTGTTKIGTLAREAWGEFDVTNELMNAIKAGYALCVYQPRKSYSGSYSSEYATFYGKGTSYEPVLIVTYEEPTTEPVASAVAGKALVGQIKVGEV